MAAKEMTTNEVELTVDKEFRELIPTPPKQQRDDLAHSVNKYGRFLDPLRYWNDGKKNLILDGHQRYDLWCSLPEGTSVPPPEVEEMLFPDREAAMEWMESYQLGRRNLDPQSLSLIRGRMYNRRKGPAHRPKSTEPSETASGTQRNDKRSQNGNVSGSARTANEVAEKAGVSKNTVLRDAEFVDALEAIRKVNGKAAKDIESKDLKVPKSAVVAIGKLDREGIGKAIRNLRAGRKWNEDEKPSPTTPKQYNDSFDVSETEKPRKGGVKELSPAKLVDELVTKHASPLVRGIDKVAEINGGKGPVHSSANECLNSLIESLKEMRKGKL